MSHITPRQQQVIQLMAGGHTYDDVASILRISRNTVKYHIFNARTQLEAHNIRHTITIADQAGIDPHINSCSRPLGESKKSCENYYFRMADEKPPVETGRGSGRVRFRASPGDRARPGTRRCNRKNRRKTRAGYDRCRARRRQAGKKPAVAPVDTQKPVAEPEAKPAPEIKAEAPKFEPLVLPEGVKLEDKVVGEIDSMFGNFELSSKAPHAEVMKLRQGMVEYGMAIVNDAKARIQQEAQSYWETKTKEFRESFEKDPEIGGAKKDETTQAAREFIAQHAGSPERAQEIRKLLFDHKLADHPAMIRLLANANLARGEGKPLPAQKAVPAKMKPWDKMYGNMT